MNSISHNYGLPHNPNQLTQKLTDKFNSADTDASGSLSKTEFAEALAGKGVSSNRAEKLFNRIDSNQDGQISLEEQQEKITAMQERMNSFTGGMPATNANFDAVSSLFEALNSTATDESRKQELQGLMKDIKTNGLTDDNIASLTSLSGEIIPAIDISA